MWNNDKNDDIIDIQNTINEKEKEEKGMGGLEKKNHD